VIGRSITRSPQPRSALRAIVREIEDGAVASP
jgi:orotidine-5'-phosphate decarboxylase